MPVNLASHLDATLSTDLELDSTSLRSELELRNAEIRRLNSERVPRLYGRF